MADVKVKILPGGPYEVSESIPLKNAVIEIDREGTSEEWTEGQHQYTPLTEPYYLCRCGHSKNKPYCDGAHNEIGFQGTETARHDGYFENAIRYEGAVVDILDDETLCASVRFCDRGPTAWGAAEQSDIPGNLEIALEECAACASGRLTIVDKDGTVHEPELPQEVSPVQDTAAQWRGPLWVKGGIQIEGADGKLYEKRNRVTLCRCGESTNMPFCDTSHLRCPHMAGSDE